jgi:hypothetical protein
MKTIGLLIAFMLALATAPTALGSDKAKDAKTKARAAEQNKKANAQSAKQQKITVTGSYIKQTVRPDGTVPEGPSPLHVISASEIQQSGASDVAQLLIKKGYNR